MLLTFYHTVQSTFELYEYPCKKYPKEIRNRKDPPAPTADEVCTYLEEYLEEKNITSKFHFNTPIREILCCAEDHWILEFDDLTTMHFTFVIVCNGLVSSKPNKIDIPGMDVFLRNGGTVMHSSERRSDEVFRNKRTIVIGNGKSAVDAAAAAAECAQRDGMPAPLQVARRQAWYVPRYILGVLPYKWAFHTRIGSSLMPRYFESTFILWQVLHLLFTPIKWFIWRLVELLLLCQYRLPFRLWPKLGTVEAGALDTSVLITDESHLKKLRNGTIDMRITEVNLLEAGKAHFSNGNVVDCDVLIMATGWQLSYDQFMCKESIFAGLDFNNDFLDFEQDGLWLYRNILPAGFKGMAFVGANTLTFINIFTAYIQAYWLAQLLAGERPWPEEEHMKATIAREKTFKQKYYKESEMRAASIELYMQHYHDVLFAEMKAKSPFNCLVRPISNMIVPMIPSVMNNCLEPSSTHQVKDLSAQNTETGETDQDSSEISV